MYGFAERIEKREKDDPPPPPKKGKLIYIRERQKFVEMSEAELHLCSAWSMVMLAREKLGRQVKGYQSSKLTVSEKLRHIVL